MTARTSPSVSYSMWLKRILDSHASQSWDAEPSGVREREDEELNDIWIEIDDCQKQRLWGLSSDLNSLRDRETWVDSDWPAISRQQLARMLQEAFQQKDWDKLLEHLRRPPRFLPRSKVDYLRGRAWMEMKHPEVALLFFDNAARLDPENLSNRVLALECVKDLQSWRELLNRCEKYVRDPKATPRLLFRVADGFQAYAKHSGEAVYYQRGVEAVDLGFEQLNRPNQQGEPASIVAGAYATKSFCLEHLGRTEDSLRVLNSAVEHFPENTTLLTARGLLKQELGLKDAIDDFHRAVTGGTIVAWAYVELARNAIQEGRNEEALEFCRKGLDVAHQDAVEALLLELNAIAAFRLRQSPDLVRTAFQRARELNPLSEEIRGNSERFERYLAGPQAGDPQWEFAATPSSAAMEDLHAALTPAA
jgi:tetratricopeptide (TPR) repeat protein